MKIPDVQWLRQVKIDGRTFTVYLIDDEWDGDTPEHSSDHGSGACECPCSPPMSVIEEAAGR